MRKDARAKIVTGLLVVGLGAFVVARQSGWRPSSSSAGDLISTSKRKAVEPRDTLYAMLDAARAGEIDAYLNCYTGEAAQRIAQSRDEMTAPEFTQYLQERNRQIKGIAIYEAEPAAEGRVWIRVEWVYQDRKEAQNFQLARFGEDWKIVDLEPAQRVEMTVPYGTPVY